MKNTVKGTALCLTAIMLISLAACGKTPEDNTPPAPATQETVTEIKSETPEAPAETNETPEAPAEIKTSDAKATEVSVTTDNNGEDDQHVNFKISFDSDAGTLLPGDFAVTIAGNELEAERISVSAEGNSAVLTLRTDAIKAGVIEVDYSGSGAHGFYIHSIVSPGMKLELVSEDKDNATTTVRVADIYHVRGIGRVMLLENGEVIKTQGEESSVFTGVHGHSFLTMDENTIAEKIVFGLGESFPEGYEFSSDGNTVTVRKLNAEGPVSLLLKVQESLEIELK